MPTRQAIENDLLNLQDNICVHLELLDGKARFQEDTWSRPGGGGGRTRVIAHGDLLEKGGVNFSAVYGELSDEMKRELNTSRGEFFATGVSIVLHPNNPHVPIIHMNVRYFELSETEWWFGGGIDLTPHYILPPHARIFHEELKETCDQFDAGWYKEFKYWADDYFFIKHRGETRGVGGIFFDRLGPERGSREMLHKFILAVGNTFIPAYTHQVIHRDHAYTEEEKRFQLLRRGRYVEFNLVYDRGTRFGLQTDGRIESILMSLPEHASWEYNPVFEAGSPEEFTLSNLKKGLNWLHAGECR
jgi:coproporphyrinogen III oxidase